MNPSCLRLDTLQTPSGRNPSARDESHESLLPQARNSAESHESHEPNESHESMWPQARYSAEAHRSVTHMGDETLQLHVVCYPITPSGPGAILSRGAPFGAAPPPYESYQSRVSLLRPARYFAEAVGCTLLNHSCRMRATLRRLGTAVPRSGYEWELNTMS